MKNPLKYYLNNIVNTINLVKIASQCGVNKFIFSFTTAMHDEPNIEKNNLIIKSAFNWEKIYD